jgi:hypothetical protein
LLSSSSSSGLSGAQQLLRLVASSANAVGSFCVMPFCCGHITLSHWPLSESILPVSHHSRRCVLVWWRNCRALGLLGCWALLSAGLCMGHGAVWWLTMIGAVHLCCRPMTHCQ